MKDQRWVRWSGIGLLVLLAGVVGVVASGWLDPKPAGDLQWERPLDTLPIPAGWQIIHPLDTAPLPDPFSLRLTAAWQSGEIDSGYGLALIDDTNTLVIAVAPTGYVAIFNSQFSILNSQLPWQTWPHVHMEDQPNEIWLDRVGQSVRVWVNREILWEGELDFQPERVGLYGVSFGETAVVDFATLNFYATSESK